MWALNTSKKGLLDLFSTNTSSIINHAFQTSYDILADNFHEEFLLLWQKKPSKYDLPSTIVVLDGSLREFLSWTSTSIDRFCPFTAFFNVINRNQVKDVFKTKEPSLGRLEDPLIGFIIGEALTLSMKSHSLENLPLLPCKSTYSFSLVRAYTLGYFQEFYELSTISEAWKKARSLTRQPKRKLPDRNIESIFNLLITSIDKSSYSENHVNRFVLEACRELISYGTVKKSWLLLENQIPNIKDVYKSMYSTREERVVTFENFIHSLTVLDKFTASFVVGLFCSQISEGTFEHINLLSNYLSKYPMSIIWYCICLGFYPHNEIKNASHCLGQRILRDLKLSDSIFYSPKYDISIEELEVYLDRESPLRFRVASQNHISVELYPGVPAIMKWPILDSTYDSRYDSSIDRNSIDTKKEHMNKFYLTKNQLILLLQESEQAHENLEKAIYRLQNIFNDLNNNKHASSFKNDILTHKYKK